MADSPVGTLIAAVGTLATVGATVIGVMTYMDGKKEKEAQLSELTASYAESSLPETTQPLAEMSAADTTAQQQTDTTASQSKTTASQTSAPETEQTAANTGTAPAVDNTVRADRDFSVRTLAEIAKRKGYYESSYTSPFFDYDPNTGLLYYVKDSTHIESCSVADGTVKQVADLTDKAELKGLAVNPYTGKLYAAVVMPRSSQTSLYCITDDKLISDSVIWDWSSSPVLADFTDRNTLLTMLGHYTGTKINISTGESYTIDLQSQQGHTAWTFTFPFLHDDCWYYLRADCGVLAQGPVTRLEISRSGQLFPSETMEMTEICRGSGRFGICAGADGLLWFDSDKNIYLCDPDGPRSEGTLLSGGENPDTLLVDGSRIQDTAENYLSKNVPLFLRIDNSHFVMYDADDSALKLLYAAD